MKDNNLLAFLVVAILTWFFVFALIIKEEKLDKECIKHTGRPCDYPQSRVLGLPTAATESAQ